MTEQNSLDVGKTPTPTDIYSLCIRNQDQISVEGFGLV